MPTEHISYSYKIGELSAAAKVDAVEAIRAKLAGDWWDGFDTENVGETILYVLAEGFKSPGWDAFGEGDFPGIAGLAIVGWDTDRGDYLAVRGELDRENAPALPWAPSIDAVRLVAGGSGTSIAVESNDDYGAEDCMAMADAVEEALSAALVAGRIQVQYIGSEENAREWIDGNDPDFNEDGSLF